MFDFSIRYKYVNYTNRSFKKKNQTLLNLVSAAISILSINTTIFLNKNPSYLSDNFDKLKHLGDHFCYGIIFFEYQLKKKIKNIKHWCIQKKINENCLNLANSVNAQLQEICLGLIPMLNVKKFLNLKIYLNLNEQFKFCFTAGYFMNSARFLTYSTKFQSICYGLLTEIYPFSLYKSVYPKIVIFHEFLVTSKPYIIGIMPTKLEWLNIFGTKIFT